MKKNNIACLGLAMALSTSLLVSHLEISRADERGKATQKVETKDKKAEIEKLEKELAGEKENLRELEAKKVMTSAAIDRFKLDKEIAKNKLEKNKKEEGSINQEISQIGSKKKLAEEKATLKDKAKKLEEAKAKLEEAYNKVRAEKEEKLKELQKLKDRNKNYDPKLQDDLDKKESQINDLNQQLKQKDAEIDQIGKEIQEAREELTKSIGKDNSYMNGIDSKKNEIEDLKNKKLQHEEALERAKEAKNNYSMGSDDKADKKAEKLKEYDETISKIQSDILENKASITRAEKEKSELEVQKASEEKNREEITKKISSLEQKEIQEKGERARLNEKINKLQSEIDDLSNKQNISPEDLKRIKELEVEIGKDDGKINLASGYLEDNKKAIKETKEEIDENERKSSKLIKLESRLSQVKKDIEENQKEIKRNEEAIPDAQGKLRKLEDQVAEQRTKVNKIQEKLYKAKGIVIPRRKDRDAEKSSEDKNKKMDEAKKKEIKKHINSLKEAVAENKISVKSGEFLLENAPKQIAPVKDKLTMLINNAKGIIEKSEKVLTKLEGLVD